ncbi:hypothetical protein T07_4391 [Trichinella nelsoni]|uniref:Uncharacterized protein n=1 Tax=Trichinella nelsoni TaxID=6336 RepID=A0A0V0RUE4_9BILA|nr:hypothetical protein T07_4391 [Trichinella nelsoni]
MTNQACRLDVGFCELVNVSNSQRGQVGRHRLVQRKRQQIQSNGRKAHDWGVDKQHSSGGSSSSSSSNSIS